MERGVVENTKSFYVTKSVNVAMKNQKSCIQNDILRSYL